MLVAYLAAPLTPHGDETREGNIQRAKEIYRELSLAHPHVVLLAPWLLNAECFEETEEFRAVGMAKNFVVIRLCDELWLCGPRVSGGMTAEAAYAIDHGIRVRDYTERFESN